MSWRPLLAGGSPPAKLFCSFRWGALRLTAGLQLRGCPELGAMGGAEHRGRLAPSCTQSLWEEALEAFSV